MLSVTVDFEIKIHIYSEKRKNMLGDKDSFLQLDL